tara:strand:+ start:5026 stop:5433 length:408 start_codon:yes stop_codon:yes gene_type:complete
MIFIGIVSLFITFILLFIINRTFDRFKIEYKQPFKLNIKSDKIIILSKEGCPWCEKLEPELAKTKNDYVKILMNNDDTFRFDDNFTQLDQIERESIIKGVRDVMENAGYYFPTIIHNNEYILGFPEDEILKKIFN